MRRGGQILIEHLRGNGCRRVFTVPGESFLPALDALRDADGMDVVVCRHEGAAAMMAETTARLTGRGSPAAGVAFVSRGPGLANAMSGLHVAMQGATPMLLMVGLPPRASEGLGGFQEVGLGGLAGSFAKHVEVVRDTQRIGEVISRALTIAHGGRAGPVIVGLPEDVLATEAEAPAVEPVRLAEPVPDYASLTKLGDMLMSAEWPVIIAGGRWSADASLQLQLFAERLDVPVVAAFRSQDVIDNRSPVYCGHAGISPAPKLAAALASADLILAVGTHIDEITSGGFQTISVPVPRQRLIHVHPAADVVGRNHRADLGLVSGISQFSERLDDLLPSVRPGMPQRWSALRRDMRAAFEAWQNIPPSPGELRLEDVVAHLSETLPDNAIVTNGAGNYAAFLHRAFTYKGPLTQLAPLSGSMGYGLPAAIAAKLAAPDREVVCMAGDGCFQMTSAEIATAVQYGAGVIVVVANNGMLGTVRTAQERTFPGRVIATSLVNPDFAELAHAHSAAGYTARTIGEFKEAMSAARSSQETAVIELVLDRSCLAPGVIAGSSGDDPQS
ncbi:MAG: thiamine pyrophosphate-binding protein [Hyphomicrobiaceae bacterium]|nr:thiamine pyrophosphate-binding protein [Hyphomicrobiaceae bacterium]